MAAANRRWVLRSATWLALEDDTIADCDARLGVDPADGRVFWVEPTSGDGRALTLTARTFFCRTGAGFYRSPRDLCVVARCPNGLFLELRRTAGLTA